ncbi:sec-independent protein translocase protein TatB [Cribrihabitans marinus]|uniref:Sec-independent protein translocase protein TatB n=1 Tax=Cribrihabitans marinus TaxID=1227549 RepID=A0A1H6RCQ3_9RHOB|nr:Sec-independent protein translocase protein TatB [Cribrihabitans marinus]GGH20510.1 Sec-independent protein translocase protein TatB [Cribrihabitans marinus]SEI51014.1 sec-independent protein translocase protein TatB [Cribrihabitans marinus]
MFDLGWTELLVIGIVALIVVGPKDLPVLFRNAGRWVGKMRGMAREFSRAMNEAADEAGVSDIQKSIKAATNPVGSAMDGVKKAAGEFKSEFDPTRYDPDSATGKLSAERAEQAKKIQAASARAAADRKAREAAEASAKADEAEAALKSAAPDTAAEPEAKS